MVKFHFTITGDFETSDTTQALLQLSHLAEITKINIAEGFKLEFNDIKVTKEEIQEPGFGRWAGYTVTAKKEEKPVVMGLVGSNIMQDDIDKNV